MKGKGRKKHMCEGKGKGRWKEDGPTKTYNASGESVSKGLYDCELFRRVEEGSLKLDLWFWGKQLNEN